MPQSPKTSKGEAQLFFTNTPNIKSEQASTIFNFPAVPSPTTSNGPLYASAQSEGKMDVLDVLNVVNVVQPTNTTNVAAHKAHSSSSTQSCSSTTNTTNSNCLNVINVNNNTAAIFVSQMSTLNQMNQVMPVGQLSQNQVKDEEIIYETIFIENSAQETIGSFQKVQKMVATQQTKPPSGGIIVLTQGSLNELLLSANTNTNKGTKKFLINNNCNSVDNKNNLQSILMINSTNLNSLNSMNSLNSSAGNQTFVGTPTQQSMGQAQFSNAMMTNQKPIMLALNNQQVRLNHFIYLFT